ncbi:MAG TPA: 50S ribosomal protein L29 [Patescibacteria group bacterium]|nr:50S ribosomal protein L29 [Patescibacteria group bacterium]
MKKKEFTDLRKKEPKELEKMSVAKKLEAKKAKLNLISSKEKNLKIYRNIRRDIAQIETVIKEKQIIGKLQTK